MKFSYKTEANHQNFHTLQIISQYVNQSNKDEVQNTRVSRQRTKGKFRIQELPARLHGTLAATREEKRLYADHRVALSGLGIQVELSDKRGLPRHERFMSSPHEHRMIAAAEKTQGNVAASANLSCFLRTDSSKLRTHGQTDTDGRVLLTTHA
ncbi:hypothetical protein E2C01_082908 [Portunus trituberculatus]|uniref:Uncharacterized protein n=1 Tax=Portunus trituberculatus TaxID=210409 RepID=A0A5B7J0C2_PORTR|nr:hypothetical protein [Portunus trituberculatus]